MKKVNGHLSPLWRAQSHCNRISLVLQKCLIFYFSATTCSSSSGWYLQYLPLSCVLMSAECWGRVHIHLCNFALEHFWWLWGIKAINPKTPNAADRTRTLQTALTPRAPVVESGLQTWDSNSTCWEAAQSLLAAPFPSSRGHMEWETLDAVQEE